MLMRAPSPPALSEVLLARLSDFLEAQIGLHFPRERWRDLERGIAATARESGSADVERFIVELIAAPLTRDRIEGLAGHLTVGETYFFREKASLDALEQHILPQLLRARALGDKRIRIWSAGCCSGEEPYSIAMLLERLIPDIENWNLTILATDINPQFLRKAARGLYGAWSFRDTPGWARGRYFSRRQDGRFEIQARIRRMVTFSYLNLADDAYPSLVNGTNAMDIIFCRNVLMYFAQARARTVVDKLQRSLIDGGWLITSPAEASTVQYSELALVGFGGAFLYRKSAAGAPDGLGLGQQSPPRQSEATVVHSPAPGALQEPAASAAAMPGLAAQIPRDAGAGQAGQAETPEPDADKREALRRRARACADAGRLAEAAAWCEEAIAADTLNSANYYLRATIEQELGQSEAAERWLARALYLDPDFALAHFALGNLCLSRGRQREARRHFGNALATLRACPAETLLRESDGISAGRLIEIITSVQASLLRVHKDKEGVRA